MKIHAVGTDEYPDSTCFVDVRFLRWPGSPSPRLCWLPSLSSLRSEQSEPPLWPEPPACQTEGFSSRSAWPTTWKQGMRNRTACRLGGVIHQRCNRRQHSRWSSFKIKSVRDKSKLYLPKLTQATKISQVVENSLNLSGIKKKKKKIIWLVLNENQYFRAEWEDHSSCAWLFPGQAQRSPGVSRLSFGPAVAPCSQSLC